MVEPDRSLRVGYHQDRTHSSLGECHLQLDHDGAVVTRAAARFLDEQPLGVLDARLDQLRALLPDLDWSGPPPALPDEDLPEPP